MKTKKTRKADLENKRDLFFSVGLVVSLAMVLSVLRISQPVNATPNLEGGTEVAPPIDYLPPIKRQEKEIVRPKMKVYHSFEINDNIAEIDEWLPEDSEAGESFTIIDYSTFKPEVEEKIEDFVDALPEFPGGDVALMTWFSRNINYPEEALDLGSQGTVFVRFAVMKTGKISNVSVLKSIDPYLDQEALRVVKKLPNWKPGMKKGKVVNVWFTVPIKFRLEN